MTDPVTQADRDAADYCQSGSDDGHTFNAMRTGECDNHPLVQAFAAHRLAAEAGIVGWLRTKAEVMKADVARQPTANHKHALECMIDAVAGCAAAIARREHAGEG